MGSGAASNLSSPGVIQQQRASLLESVSGDMSAMSFGHSGSYPNYSHLTEIKETFVA